MEFLKMRSARSRGWNLTGPSMSARNRLGLPIVNSDIQQSEDSAVQLMKSAGLRLASSGQLVAEHRMVGILSFASRQKDRFVGPTRSSSCARSFAMSRLPTTACISSGSCRKRIAARMSSSPHSPTSWEAAGADSQSVEDHATQGTRSGHRRPGPLDDGSPARANGPPRRRSPGCGSYQRGKLNLRKERIELVTVINNAIDAARPLIQAAGHELTVSFTPEPIYLDADPRDWHRCSRIC